MSRIALVTGGSRGIGAAISTALQAAGYTVAATYAGNDEKAAAFTAETGIKTYKWDVSDYDACAAGIAAVEADLGPVDILVNNAGILRDKSFSKGTVDDFRLVADVHLMGTVHCTKACWDIMKAQEYGRIVVTSSSSGLYGNFGQSNYGAAKMAVVGMMNTLAQEGAKYNVKINALAPTAGTRMTEGLIDDKAFALLTPETVTPAVLFLVSDEAPTRAILAAGAGAFAVAKIVETEGMWLPEADQTPEGIAANWSQISEGGERALQAGFEQSIKMIGQAAAGLGLDMSQ